MVVEERKNSVQKRNNWVRNLDVKKISEEHGCLKLLVKGADVQLLNAIRRTVMNNVPVLAMEDIAIYENNSVLFDEFLGNRLALLPIKMDKSYKEGEKVKFTLKKQGPGMVYSSDIKCKDPKMAIAYKDIPIVKLKEGQKIKLEITAVVGTGKQHAKWQPALISYKQLPKIKHKKLPQGIAKIAAKNSYEWTEHEMEKLAKEGAEFDYSGNNFLLMIESYAGLKNSKVLETALKRLGEKAEEFRKEIAKVK